MPETRKLDDLDPVQLIALGRAQVQPKVVTVDDSTDPLTLIRLARGDVLMAQAPTGETKP